MQLYAWALAAQTVGLLVAMGLVLFLAAGTLTWLAGWVFLLQFGTAVAAINWWLLVHDPALLRERMGGFRQDQPLWDKLLLLLAGVLYFDWLAFMALDAVRWQWSRVPVFVQDIGALLLLCGLALVFWTLRENTFLACTVRLQTERGHTLVDSGPYQYVRHPMYAGVLLFVVGTALLLGSWYGLLPGALLVGVVARRAVLEERLLHDQLGGYAAYMVRVRYRLIPGVW